MNIEQKIIGKIFFTIIVFTLAVLFSGCGGTGDGDGSPPGTVGENLVKNGGFEEDFTNWNFNGGQNVCFFLENAIRADGAKSLKVLDCLWNGLIYQRLNVEPDTDYVFTVSCLVSRDDSAPWGILIKISEDYTRESPLIEVKSAGSGWKSYKGTFNSKERTTVDLGINGNASEFFVDRLSVYKVAK